MGAMAEGITDEELLETVNEHRQQKESKVQEGYIDEQPDTAEDYGRQLTQNKTWSKLRNKGLDTQYEEENR